MILFCKKWTELCQQMRSLMHKKYFTIIWSYLSEAILAALAAYCIEGVFCLNIVEKLVAEWRGFIIKGVSALFVIPVTIFFVILRISSEEMTFVAWLRRCQIYSEIVFAFIYPIFVYLILIIFLMIVDVETVSHRSLLLLTTMLLYCAIVTLTMFKNAYQLSILRLEFRNNNNKATMAGNL